MLTNRVIPCLLLREQSLVKTIKFDKVKYIGDPVNTARIFNELEVDELAILDILASSKKREIQYEILEQLANECFMPLSYGGGIRSLEDAKKILSIGFEKVILNTSAAEKPTLIRQIADTFGSQSIIVSIDVKKNFWGKYDVMTHSGNYKTKLNPIDWAKEAEKQGAGELLITSIDREGTWKGFDVEILKKIRDNVSIPVIAHGGAGSTEHIKEVFKTNVSAVALGSMVVFQSQGMGVLINFPDRKKLREAIK